MLEKIKNAKFAVGVKQSTKLVNADSVATAFVARDAQDKVTVPCVRLCGQKGVPVEYADTMDALGKACGIEVGAAIAVILK